MDFPVSRRLPGTWISGPVVEFVLPEDLRPAGNSPVALQVRFPCQLSQGDSTWTFRCPDASPGPGFRGLWSNLYCPKTFARREIRLWRFKCDSPANCPRGIAHGLSGVPTPPRDLDFGACGRICTARRPSPGGKFACGASSAIPLRVWQQFSFWHFALLCADLGNGGEDGRSGGGR